MSYDEDEVGGGFRMSDDGDDELDPLPEDVPVDFGSDDEDADPDKDHELGNTKKTLPVFFVFK